MTYAQTYRIMNAVAAEKKPFPKVAAPVDVLDAAQFPEIALARASFAARSAEERARLLREWG